LREERKDFIIMNECQNESGRRIIDYLIDSSSTLADGDRRMSRGYGLILGEGSFVQV
jgi:hypothetical protein